MSEVDKPSIVVGADGSEHNIRALEWAIRRAKLLGADVHAIGAWEVPNTIWITPTATESDYQRAAAEGFDKAIAEAVLRVGTDGEGVTVETRLVQQRASKALQDAARGAVSLVIGSHGHGSTFPGMHLGSTASFCVHHAPCPVVVIRQEAA